MSTPPEIERLALLGWRLHPASRFSRAAAIKGAAEAATHDLDCLERWAAEFPGCNWRVVMGGSKVWGLDVDAPSPDHAADGIAALAGLVATHGPLPPRPMIRTGGGGYALFFRDGGEPISGRTGTPAPGLDPRRGRLTVTVPPSIHHRTRARYRWITAPWEIAPPPAPAWLLRAVAPPPPVPIPHPSRMPAKGRPYAVGALRRAVAEVATAFPGTRNDVLNRAAWSLSRLIADGSLAPSEIAEALAHAGRVAGMDHHEVARTIASALTAGGRA